MNDRHIIDFPDVEIGMSRDEIDQLFNDYVRSLRAPGIVKHNLARARARGLPATLTTEQWVKTVIDNNGMCTYCYENPYQVLDHFIPLKRGGGTTFDNCVPACYKCNVIKGSYDPFHMPLFPTIDGQKIVRALPGILWYLYYRRELEAAR